jgi:hypothetical protein
MFTKEDPKDRKLAFMHCWNILKDKPKWMTRRRDVGCAKKTSNKKQKIVANSTPGSAAIPPVAPIDVRVFFTAGYRAVYRGYRRYRWGTVTVPSGRTPPQIQI